MNWQTKKHSEFRLIKDLKKALKDFEPMVKDPKHLWNGRNLKNFNLLPREAWGNWLVSAVLCEISGRDVTFADADSEKVDGYIIDRSIKAIFPTEHVSALDIPKAKKLPKGEQRIINAINLKISRGPKYSQGKLLVAFFDGAGEFFRTKIREAILGKHNFEAVFCVGLLNSGKDGYSYIVTEFRDSFKDQSITHKVEINGDFTDWKISQIMA
ncbi:MAG: hypothetical protein UT20_C0024G0008 [Candidatus Levybacteria bacterium GW2011_GWA1_39_11]|uniref:Uncharacterized protein n=1 Tax=Candidatus Giovannonibacteria bacterium GW2011_GWA2_45_21 TaxID=1618649 RepID=A0A0G1Q9F8_9BACT|nr:MAG: hypothetical protein UT20_C0024G0008 [Candidatus Levybacteria bacterium GW2011_GWA1_39_11]KKU05260.1 MAG: hypothetical protein UX06_C0001G0021 [Candidatus Giovannonibacteria bacterium GW2011_GWA2_45_21]